MATILSRAVGLANGITKKLGMQVNVRVGRSAGDGGTGDPTETWRVVSVAFEEKLKQVRTFGGELGTSKATMTVVGPTEFKEGDLVVTPAGKTMPVIGTSTPVDASGRLVTEVYL